MQQSPSQAPDTDCHADKDNVRQWPVLFTGDLPIQNYTCRFLQNQRELVAEGFAMKHCVGTYGGKCAAGASQILSIRNHQRQSLATVELHLYCRGDEYRFEVTQKRGVANAPIAPCAEHVLATFLQLLHQPRLQTRLKQLHTQQTAMGSMHRRLLDDTPMAGNAERLQILQASLTKGLRARMFEIP